METTPLTGLPGAVQFQLPSQQVDDTFTISVIVPDLSALGQAAAASRFRVFYVTDADLVFPAAWSALGPGGMGAFDPDKGFEPVILVGIGYGDLARMMIARARDLTPPGTPVSDEAKQGLGDNVLHGQADNFLRFIETELDPLIRKEFPAADGPAGLYGFSYGGLFSAYAMFTRSPLFDRYVIGSPGNVFPDDLLLDLESRCFEAGTQLNVSAFLTCGSLERTSVSAGLRYITVAYDKLAARLQSRHYEGFTLTCREYDNESHLSYTGRCLADGLNVLYPPGHHLTRLTAITGAQSIAAAKELEPTHHPLAVDNGVLRRPGRVVGRTL